MRKGSRDASILSTTPALLRTCNGPRLVVSTLLTCSLLSEWLRAVWMPVGERAFDCGRARWPTSCTPCAQHADMKLTCNSELHTACARAQRARQHRRDSAQCWRSDGRSLRLL